MDVVSARLRCCGKTSSASLAVPAQAAGDASLESSGAVNGCAMTEDDDCIGGGRCPISYGVTTKISSIISKSRVLNV